MDEYTFDAPQFVDFTQPEILEDIYGDAWFDRHTEIDDFVRLSKEGDDTKASERKKPQRVLRSIGGTSNNKQIGNGKVEIVDTNCKSPRYLSAKPTRVLVGEKHTSQTCMKAMCPSPLKKQKTTDDQYVVDSSSNNRAQNTSLPTDHQEVSIFSDDCPAANTRLRTPNTEVNSKSPHSFMLTKSKSPKRNLTAVQSPKATRPKERAGTSYTKETYQNSVNNSPATARKVPERLVTVKRSQSLKCVMPSKTGSMTKLNKPEQFALNVSSKEKSADTDLSVSSAAKTKTTEQLELEKIAAMKRELARTRKLAQDSYKKAMSTIGYVPMRSSQPATISVGFHFKTDERVKNPEGQLQEHKVKDFAKSLREALPQSALPTRPQVHGLTRPQPFKLASAKSTSSLVQAQKFESVAEKVAAFHVKTPDRFKSHPHGPKGRSRSANKQEESGHARRLRSKSPKLTLPKTPVLTARGRTRPVNALTREEKEQLEYEAHQKQQFKAHPVNPKVFDAPIVPKIAPKPVTTIEEFNIHSQKSDLVAATEKDTDEKYEFHARPVNPKILAGPVGIKHVDPKPITIAESPAFALKTRVRMPVELPEKEEVKESIKANPVPYAGIPFKPRLAHHCTVPEPFTVEERSRAMLTRRDHKIQQVFEEERKAREFYAQDIPKDGPDNLPPKQVKPITLAEPFHLEVDDRGERYQRELKFKLEEAERVAREVANFKAGPNHVIHKEPFLALKSAKPLTERNNFALNTDVRAAQREEFDQHLKAKEAEVEALKRQREERIEREAQIAVARLRTEAVHRATSIKRYKSVVVKPSDKPPTEAQSPRFSQRVRSKHNGGDV